MTNPSSPGFDAESTKGGGTFVRRRQEVVQIKRQKVVQAAF